jgi:uncharacterized membrane protein YqhA
MADPPREEAGESPMDKAEDGSSQPGAVAAGEPPAGEVTAREAPAGKDAAGKEPPGEVTAGKVATGRASAGTPRRGDARSRLEGGFEQALSLSRVVIIVPVIILLLAALSSFAYGTDVFIRSVANVVEDPELTAHNLGYLLLLTDLFLVGATLMIAAFGFYSLFITGTESGGLSLRLPRWLRMHDLNDLKARVISMIILVAGVTFVDVAVESKTELNTLYLGAAVALVIVALTVFLHFGRMDGGDDA